jgi:putative copper export protein
MDLGDVFLTLVLWLHTLAAATWVGGSIFYLIVLSPTVKRVPDVPRALSSAIGVEFRTIVVTSIIVLVATGAILAFNRLTEVEPPYAVTLGTKVALSVWMFLLVRDRRRHLRTLGAFEEKPPPPTTFWSRTPPAVSGYNTLVILGVVIFLLSDVMKVLFEIELRTE